ncbi:MAG: hypothetical protein K2P68_01335 [Sphingomonas sp.]|nr:hypothetical protein [Sphingomonas sp.]
MKLIDLDPRWLIKDGLRVGFVFKSPTNQAEWQSCFENPPSIGEQCDLFDEQVGEDAIVQPCNAAAHWQIAGGINAASFETMTVTPSLDGSAGGLWHGFITNGEIVGGI